jgi:integrase/recombinase XerD
MYDMSLHAYKRSKNEKKLPVVLTIDEITRLLNRTSNIKHKTILALMHTCGLKPGELVRLKIRDIDSIRGIIRLKQTRGRKERYTLLSKTALLCLREYWLNYRPNAWLFPGNKPGKHLSAKSAERIFQRAS